MNNYLREIIRKIINLKRNIKILARGTDIVTYIYI